MVIPRAVAVVGYKAAGKTRVIEVLVSELTRRGYRVGTLKHTTEDQPLDKVGTDTWRHAEAGAISSAILSDKRTAIFLKRSMSLYRTVDVLGEVDFILMEGFKNLDIVPRILVLRSFEEIEKLATGLEIAAVKIDGKPSKVAGIQTLSICDASSIANIVEKHAYPILGGLNCRICGYQTCKDMGKAILQGLCEAYKCVRYSGEVMLKVDDSKIPLNEFTGSTLANIVLGFLKTLKGSETPHHVELEFEVRGGD